MCEGCGGTTHRDDAMNRRCNGCERLVHQCVCHPETVNGRCVECLSRDRTYLNAKCTTAHEDESACIPLWDGLAFVCLYKLDKEIQERLNPLGVVL